MNKNDCIYAAGFMDGEGCITTSQNTFRVTITNTNRPILDWFLNTFGGNINNQHIPKNPRWNTAWKWVAASRKDVASFLKAVRPYLKVKASEADVVLSYLQKHSEKYLRSPDRKIDYEAAKLLLRSLKTDKHYVR